MDQSDANAALATAAGLIQGALGWYHTNEPSVQLDRIHRRLALIADEAEGLAAVEGGTFNVRPLDGEPKPGG